MREDWERCTISEVSEVLNGDRGKNYPSRAHYVYSGIPFVSAGNIGDNKKLRNELNFITEEKFELLRAGKLQRNDIVYCIRGSIGKFAIIDFDQGAIASSLCIIRTNEIVDRNYFCYYLESPLCSLEINKFDNGTAQPNLSAKDFKRFELPLSSKSEQRAIVAQIEELFSDLDKGVADLKKAQDQLKVYRQAVLKKAFEGDFTKSWRDSKELNSDWTTYTFAEITESLKRGPFGGDLKKSFFVENGYAVYEQQHAINNDFTTIRYHIDQERYDKLKACNVGPGDYIVSCSGTMGKIARLPKGSPNGVINQALLRIRINESIISHEYFLEYFRSALFQRKILKDSRGSGMQNMAGIREIKPIRIKVPTLLEQSQIIKEIESRLSICNKVEISITESLEKAEVLRQSILKKAFEGRLLSNEEIEKCKSAPDYEPAAVLLEKIKMKQ